MIQSLTKKLLAWFEIHGRKDLPWQKKITPYSVWISEIMLQQTQVATVIPYYERFLSFFPDVKSLAEGNLDTVLHLWTGLGYYARARNLFKAAQMIMERDEQQLPCTLSELMSLPGIGRSTAGAILSIAFNQPSPILDGNVKRVLTRYHMIAGYPGEKHMEDELWQLAKLHTPTSRCADYTQAIMDLGATVCTRSKPNCSICPLHADCKAFKQNAIADFPQKKRKTVVPIKTTYFLILTNKKGEVLLERRSFQGIWGGLWGFPEVDHENFLIHCQRKFGCEAGSYQKGQTFRHTFTHFHLDITPVYIKVKKYLLNVCENEIGWFLANCLPKIGLAAPVKKLLILNDATL